MDTWIIQHWQYILVALYVAEKVVKLTPWKADDIVIDIIGKTLMRFFSPKK